MAVFWITYRLENDETYDDRYHNLTNALTLNATRFWQEPTSFALIETRETIGALAGRLKATIDSKKDVVLVSARDDSAAVAVGTVRDSDLKTLVPHVVFL